MERKRNIDTWYIPGIISYSYSSIKIGLVGGATTVVSLCDESKSNKPKSRKVANSWNHLPTLNVDGRKHEFMVVNTRMIQYDTF